MGEAHPVSERTYTYVNLSGGVLPHSLQVLMYFLFIHACDFRNNFVNLYIVDILVQLHYTQQNIECIHLIFQQVFLFRWMKGNEIKHLCRLQMQMQNELHVWKKTFITT